VVTSCIYPSIDIDRRIMIVEKKYTWFQTYFSYSLLPYPDLLHIFKSSHIFPSAFLITDTSRCTMLQTFHCSTPASFTPHNESRTRGIYCTVTKPKKIRSPNLKPSPVSPLTLYSNRNFNLNHYRPPHLPTFIFSISEQRKKEKPDRYSYISHSYRPFPLHFDSDSAERDKR
jgi:hypothetical protein